MAATEAVELEALFSRFAELKNYLIPLAFGLGLPSRLADLGHGQAPNP